MAGSGHGSWHATFKLIFIYQFTTCKFFRYSTLSRFMYTYFFVCLHTEKSLAVCWWFVISIFYSMFRVPPLFINKIKITKYFNKKMIKKSIAYLNNFVAHQTIDRSEARKWRKKMLAHIFATHRILYCVWKSVKRLYLSCTHFAIGILEWLSTHYTITYTQHISICHLNFRSLDSSIYILLILGWHRSVVRSSSSQCDTYTAWILELSACENPNEELFTYPKNIIHQFIYI